MKSFFDDFFENKYKLYLFLILPALLLYKKTLLFGFSPMDEQWWIEDNAWFISDWSNLKAAFTGPTTFIVYYRPLVVISTMLDYQFGKLEPFVYHLQNVLWHLGCVVLFFKFLIQCNTSVRVAFFMALLFSVHPIMLHSVAWVPGRNDSMLCFFMLASLVCLNTYRAGRKTGPFVAHIFFFLCALLTKENAIALPFVYFALLFLGQKENKKVILLSSSLWLLLTCCWLIIRRNFVGPIPNIDFGFQTLEKTIIAFLVYLGKTIFPVQQSVFPVVKHASVIPGIVTLLLFGLLWWRFKPANKVIALLGFFLCFVLLIIPIGFGVMKSPGELYENRLYAPMIGVFLFLSQLRYNIKPVKLNIIFICMAVCLALTTVFRMDVYKDKLSFLDAGIKSFPEYYYFYLEKGKELVRKGDYEAAIKCFDEAIAWNTNSEQAYFDRGNAFTVLGMKEKSIADLSSALERAKPTSKAEILKQRCNTFNIFDEPELAMNDLLELKQNYGQTIEPDLEKKITRNWEIRKWNDKIRAAPTDASLYVMRAMFFMEQIMGKEALRDFQKACELEPDNLEFRECLRRASIDLAPSLENEDKK